MTAVTHAGKKDGCCRHRSGAIGKRRPRSPRRVEPYLECDDGLRTRTIQALDRLPKPRPAAMRPAGNVVKTRERF